MKSLLVLAIAASHPGAAAAATLTVGSAPFAVAVNTRSDRAYVANQAANGSVSVIDAGASSLVATIPVAPFPRALAVDEGRNHVFVASYTTNVVQIIDGNNNNIVDTINNSADVPNGMAFAPPRSHLYVASHNDNRVNVFDVSHSPATKLAGIDVGHIPEGIVFDPTANVAYVVLNIGQLAIIDDNNLGLKQTLDLGATTHNINFAALNAATHKLYLNDASGNNLLVLNAANLTAAPILVPVAAPFGVAVNPSLNRVYVVSSPLAGAGSLVVVDGANNQVIRTVPVGAVPAQVAVMAGTGFINAGENRVFVANSNDNTASEIAEQLVNDLITVPLLVCALEGSSAAHDIKTNGAAFVAGDDFTRSTLIGRVLRSSQIWLQQADLVFRLAPGATVPVVACADYECVKPGLVRENSSGPGSTARQNCIAAWQSLNGISNDIKVVLNAQVIQNTGSVGQTAPSLSLFFDAPLDSVVVGSLYGAQKYPAICSSSHSGLMTADVAQTYCLVNDTTTDPGADQTLAHELGHGLLLGHGNGFDDDFGQPSDTQPDGTVATIPPSAGVRDYDSYCSYFGERGDTQYSIEDSMFGVPATAANCAGTASMMDSGYPCTNLRPLQVEHARATGLVAPGAFLASGTDPASGQLALAPPCGGNLPECGVAPEVLLLDASITETPGSTLTGFAATVLGPIPADGDDEYWLLADLDDNPATGCAPSSLGLATGFGGAELVTRVEVQGAGGVLAAAGTVWSCRDGVFSPSGDPGIAAEARGGLLGGAVVQVPAAVRGPMADRARVQAIARQRVAHGEVNQLPADGLGGEMDLTPPLLPSCVVSPAVAEAGQTAALFASGLPAGAAVDVAVGQAPVAAGNSDAGGLVHLQFTVPNNLAPGLQSVTVLARGTARYAQCQMRLLHQAATCTNPVVIADGTCSGCAAGCTGTDAHGVPSTCVQSVSCVTGLGPHPYSCTCTDAAGATATCEGAISVFDATPPAITCPADQTLECSDHSAVASFAPSATDNCGVTSIECTPPSGSSFPEGTSRDTCVATDVARRQVSCSFNVEVHDTVGPVVALRPGSITLSPADRGYRQVRLGDCVESVTDQCGGALDVSGAVITRVTSDEAELGSGHTCDDIVLVDPSTVSLRAERDGGGDGRVYTISATIFDHDGNSTPFVCRVEVRHDQSGAPAVAGAPVWCAGPSCGGLPGADPRCLP